MLTLIKKEFLELRRTKKIIILPFVFVLFGLFSPIIAKVTPTILADLSKQSGFEIVIPDPTVLDSYTQFYKNLTQIVLFVIIFMSTSMFIKEKTKGTVKLLIAKPLSKLNIIYSKLLVMSIYIFISLLLGGIFFGIYTYYIFNELEVIGLTYSLLLYYLYMMFVVIITIFTSTISRSYSVSLIITFTIYMLLSAVQLFNYGYIDYLPSSLSNYFIEIIVGNVDNVIMIKSIVGTIVISIIILLLSLRLFKNQEY